MKIHLNGKLINKEDAKISVFDHGFLYGDGAFEGIRSYNSSVFKLKEHVKRLYETCHSLMIEVPITQQQMCKSIIDTLKANKLKDGYIRAIVTRGEGDLGLDPRKCKGKASVIIITDNITLYPKELYNKGMEIITVPTLQNNPNALNPQLKSLNYLNNILAKIEANNAGYCEAIMMDANGYITECTGDNIFIIKDGVLLTPNQGHLKGITREIVLDIAKTLKIPTKETFITRHDVYVADECFLTGTAAEVIPIVKVDGRTIATGKPGKRTAGIIKKFQVVTKNKGVKY
ncbi:MAG: branched-chain amino acid aminotransferase [Lysobacterales bacterium]|jgi:branched-chain amino acid aminotransferase